MAAPAVALEYVSWIEPFRFGTFAKEKVKGGSNRVLIGLAEWKKPGADDDFDPFFSPDDDKITTGAY